jgi:hypothetical protein
MFITEFTEYLHRANVLINYTSFLELKHFAMFKLKSHYKFYVNKFINCNIVQCRIYSIRQENHNKTWFLNMIN